jgi:hypothetical protein
MSAEFFELFDKLVPESGQAATAQGELVRAICKMSEELVSNGFANWDSGYERLSIFALRHLTDGTFGPQTSAGIRSDIEHIQASARGDEEGDYDLEEAFDRLMEATVGWCQRHQAAIPHEKDPELKR